ncbi:MAG: GtrA family protein [Pseudomonadota bacterium]
MSSGLGLARYAVCGVLTSGVYLLAGQFFALQFANAALSSSCAFVVAVVFNYWLQHRWVFALVTPVSRSLPKYALMVGTGLVLNAITVELLTPRLALVSAQLVAVLVVVAANAVLSFGWVFRTGRASDGRGA